MKKTSYKTNSWWNHRMVAPKRPINRSVDSIEDYKQNQILAKLEDEFKKLPSRKKKKLRKNSV